MMGILLIAFSASGQVAVNADGSSPDPSAMLDVKSATLGFLAPRMSTSDRNAIAAPAEGLMVYDTDLHALFIYHSGWKLTLDSNTGWLLTGNSGTDPSANFLGTIDNVPLKFRTNNALSGLIDPVKDNVGFGKQALSAITSGMSNTAIGDMALGFTSTGGFNVAVGYGSAFQNTGGWSNVSVGADAMTNNSTGSENVAIGVQAMNSNTTGYGNIAIGYNALYTNTDRSHLVAIGDSALFNNGLGVNHNYEALNNTAVGTKSLYANTTGYLNTAVGNISLKTNTIGYANTAIGDASLRINTNGHSNTAIGNRSLYDNTVGTDNTAVGYCSVQMADNDYNTSIGAFAGGNVSCGTFLGAVAGQYASGYDNCMALGYMAMVTASNQVVVGNTSVTSIGGQVGWTTFSDGRFKKNVSENIPGLDFISLLRPVTYTLDVTSLNADLNKNRPVILKEGQNFREESPEEKAGIAAQENIVYTGFIAQEVEAAAHQIGYNFSGVDAPQNADGHFGLRYAEFVVPLVKAVQEQQQMIGEMKQKDEQLEQKNRENETQITELIKRIELLEDKK